MFGFLICFAVLIFKSESEIFHSGIPNCENQFESTRFPRAAQCRARLGRYGCGNPDITIHFSKNNNPKYIVVMNEPLRIILKNFYARIVRCYDDLYLESSSSFVYEDALSGTSDSVHQISNVTDIMSTIWKCQVLQDYRGGISYQYNNHYYTCYELFFNLHVKAAISVRISVNNLILPQVNANLSVEYDGEARYSYVHGEMVDLSCEHQKYGSLRLKYYDAHDVLIFETANLKRKAQFRSLLKPENSDSYVDCIYLTSRPEDAYRYRTTFSLRNLDLDANRARDLMVSVNGLKLTPLPSNLTNNVNTSQSYTTNYQYKYICGEILNTTCEKNKETEGTLRFTSSDRLENVRAHGKQSEKVYIALDSRHVVNKTLTCGIENTNKEARILFLSKLQYNELRLIGLPVENVEYEYIHAEYQRVMAYQYTVNETLDLTCVTEIVNRGKLLHWVFEDEVIKAQQNIDLVKLIQNITHKFTLGAKHNGSTIVCKNVPSYLDRLNRSIRVILHLKPEDTNHSEIANDDTTFLMIIGSTVGVIIVIITTVCAVCWYTKTKNIHPIQNAYENLSNQNDSPIPAFPTQWENPYEDTHYTKIEEDATLENRKFLPGVRVFHGTPQKRQSNAPSESHYTEIDEYFKPQNDDPQATCNNVSNNNSEDIHKRQAGSKNYGNVKPGSSSINYGDSRQSNSTSYDKLSRSNMRINNVGQDSSSNRYGNVHQNASKKDSGIFRQRSCSWIDNQRPVYNNNIAIKCKQDCTNTRVSKLKENSNNSSDYANVNQDKEYTHPSRNTLGKPKAGHYENTFVQNENSQSLEYAEPYTEPSEMNCENEFYG